MLSNQVLQRTISEIENIAGGSCSVWALDGHRIVQAGTESPGAGEEDSGVFGGDKKRGDYSGNGGGTSRICASFLCANEEKPAINFKY